MFCEQRVNKPRVKSDGLLKLALRDALAVRVRVEYGAGADEQRRAPVREVRDVGREADDLALEAPTAYIRTGSAAERYSTCARPANASSKIFLTSAAGATRR